MVLEFERAQRMCHALDRIRLAVREVVSGIDAPLGSGAGVLCMQDAIEHRVAQIDIASRHVDLGPQYTRPVGELAFPHTAEEIEIFGYRPVAVGAVAPGL